MTSINVIRTAVENNAEEIEKILCENTGAKFFFDEEYLLRKYVEYLCKDLTVEEVENLDKDTQKYLYECYREDDDFGGDFADALNSIIERFCEC